MSANLRKREGDKGSMSNTCIKCSRPLNARTDRGHRWCRFCRAKEFSRLLKIAAEVVVRPQDNTSGAASISNADPGQP